MSNISLQLMVLERDFQIGLRTANAGYLTRRLIDVAQDVIISEEDWVMKRVLR